MLNEFCDLTGRMESWGEERSRRLSDGSLHAGPGVHLLGIIKLVVAHGSHSLRAVKPESMGL